MQCICMWRWRQYYITYDSIKTNQNTTGSTPCTLPKHQIREIKNKHETKTRVDFSPFSPLRWKLKLLQSWWDLHRCLNSPHLSQHSWTGTVKSCIINSSKPKANSSRLWLKTHFLYFFHVMLKRNEGKDGIICLLCILSISFCNSQLLDAVECKYAKSQSTHTHFPWQKWQTMVFIPFDGCCSSCEHWQLLYLFKTCHAHTYTHTVKWSNALWRSHQTLWIVLRFTAYLNWLQIY